MTQTAAYTDYYQYCYNQYNGTRCAQAGFTPDAAANPIYRFTAEVALAGESDGADAAFHFPSDWDARVRKLAASAATALDDDNQIYRPPGLAPEVDPARRLANPIGLDGLNDVVETIVSRVEQALYGCHVAVDKVHVYRQLPTAAPFFSNGSWVWHADGHPSEFIKALVYLSDVDESCSAFQLLWSDQRARALRTISTPMHEHNWISGEARIGSLFDDHFISEWNQRGYRTRTIHGAAGTTVLFATNCVHRGTLGRGGVRDTLGLRLRPTTAPQVPRLQAKSTIGEYTMSQAFAS